MLVRKLRKKHNTKTCSPSSLFWGSIIALSYLQQEITEKTIITEVTRVIAPKSSGVYNLVIIGAVKKSIACAAMLPANSLATFAIKWLLVIFFKKLLN
jgi:hypothetical protein